MVSHALNLGGKRVRGGPPTAFRRASSRRSRSRPSSSVVRQPVLYRDPKGGERRGGGTVDPNLHERIRLRAYELLEQEGRTYGRTLDHCQRGPAEIADGHAGTGGDESRGGEQGPSDLAADEAARG